MGSRTGQNGSPRFEHLPHPSDAAFEIALGLVHRLADPRHHLDLGLHQFVAQRGDRRVATQVREIREELCRLLPQVTAVPIDELEFPLDS